ncbi:hypothetical protein AAY86_27030 [Pseudomonas amygdali pv. tabaci str. ATCC 11528]|jgi:hypothetical protein|uniref:Uncharacterized protein n=5 Tax=Pseudomonas syringae group TaxID=136849 RepID=A0A3M3PGC4_PSESX|nr:MULTISPECIES: hypothetical protein [Pseudomonas syringae group]OZI86970.1 hypothetical protein CFN58_07265 [Pseudomonas avellanae]AQX41954.1 hypothetical protein [Pseudomonas syringae pv. syringae]AQX42020.1 hypothetical protein [Pseudomonas syringae pv. syringae]AQX42226.1 hypothetical protein [Pseudomonas syringae pv. syringae]ATV21171.1 hypothetical protein CT122_31630 [Pseudomonas syringae pv. actinidiae]
MKYLIIAFSMASMIAISGCDDHSQQSKVQAARDARYVENKKREVQIQDFLTGKTKEYPVFKDEVPPDK